MSIHWASDPFVVVDHAFPFEAAFGLIIPVGIASVIFFVMVMLESQSRTYLFIWGSLVCIATFVPLGLTSQPSLSAWIDKWDNEWTNTSYTMAFQFEKSCCGWRNYTDRAIDNCSFVAISGCEKMVTEWIEVRYRQIFLVYIFIAVMNMYSVIYVFWNVLTRDIDCLWAEIEIPLLPTTMYATVE